MIEQGKTKRQEIKMLNRKILEISGVRNVESFDSEEFLLETELWLSGDSRAESAYEASQPGAGACRDRRAGPFAHIFGWNTGREVQRLVREDLQVSLTSAYNGGR